MDSRLAIIKTAAGANQVIATVPSNERWVVTDIQASNFSGVESQLKISLHDSGSTVFTDIVNATLNQGLSTAWSGRVVLEPGDVIYCFTFTEAWNIWISGTRETF